MTGRSSFEDVVLDWSIDQPTTPLRLPVALLSKEQMAAELQRVQQRRAMDAAYEAELILGMAEQTPDRFDPPPNSPGAKRGGWAADNELPGVSEFFTAELAMVLNCGRGTASYRAKRAWTLRESLPATFAALDSGEIDERRAVLADVLQHTAPAIARAVEARLLPEATGLTLGRLKARAVELTLELDAQAADRRRAQAKRSADVRTYPSHLDGMAALTADLPAEEAAACYDLIDRLATMLKADGDPRPIGELRAAVLSMLIRRPADDGLSGATVQLTVTAALTALTGESAAPGSVNGLPITAAHLRELLVRVGALGLTTPDEGTLTFALTDASGVLLGTVTLAQLHKLARRGCTEHPDGDCGCAVLGRSPATEAYEPTDAQRAFVKTRDRCCRFPNCGQRVGWADLDHVVPHSCGGETTCTNLCCLCRSHHRLKTFTRGWRFVMDPDGTLRVTTPSGITRTTRPPGLRPPPPEPPAHAEERPHPVEPDDHPPRPVEPDDDPPHPVEPDAPPPF